MKHMNMNDQFNHEANERRMARALAAIDGLQAKLAEAEQAVREPIAIVGLGCRFPGGADTPQAFWQLLTDQRDGIGPVPADRWDAEAWYDPDPDRPGRTVSREGGFVGAPADFDADFFGISAKEAATLDPQQRLLLEVGWEALEHAGIVPGTLAGSPAGVFVGISSNDYANLLLQRPPEAIDAYLATGNSHSVAAGRLSYYFGFNGPSMIVDTACSSSLVAVHLACQALRAGEANLALAGGVNRILTPDGSLAFSRAHMLAADSRCKSFAAAADGFVRSEGCGIVVLKLLRDAQSNGDRIWALIRGSAVNQDGRSSGLTVPNGPAQQAVIRRALSNAGVEAGQIDYIEAHGTGTALGDPIEAGALGEVFGKQRPRPLWLGSVKANLGHLEAAAGICGLIKTALALHHGTMPPQAHFNHPSPHIDWQRVPLQIPLAATPWPETDSRYAGVSSFGFSGTNAHIVLSGAPVADEPSRSAAVDDHPDVLMLSARDTDALRQLANAYLGVLRQTGSGWRALCWSALATRSRFNTRLAVTAANAGDAATALERRLAGDLRQSRTVSAKPPKVAFLFTGQGAQYRGMGQALYVAEPVFRAALDRCAQVLWEEQGWSLTQALFDDGGPDLDATGYAQPALFSLAHALCELWQAWGIKPAAVLGHSIGEFAAAVSAGVFDWRSGLKLVASRGRLMQQLPADGGMAVLRVSAREAAAWLPPGLTLAADNAPQLCTVSGDRAALAELAVLASARNVGMQPLKVSHAFHSPLMRPMLAEFAAVAGRFEYRPPSLPVYSTLTGTRVGTEAMDAGYWSRQISAEVRFRPALEALLADGVDCLLEIGPQAHLTALAGMSALAGNTPGLASQIQGEDGLATLVACAGTLFEQGCDMRRPDSRTPVDLPFYPFQRRRFWFSPTPVVRKPLAIAAGHPLLGRPMRVAGDSASRFETEFDAASLHWPLQHRVFGQEVLPAAGFVEIALAAAAAVSGGGRWSHIDFSRALLLNASAPSLLQTQVTREEGAGRFEIFSLAADDTWLRHAGGLLEVADERDAPLLPALAVLQTLCTHGVDPEACYLALHARHIEYGPAFRALTQIRIAADTVLSHARLPAEVAAQAADYRLHPVLFDACLQSIAALFIDSGDTPTFLPAGIDALELMADVRPTAVWCGLKIRHRQADGLIVDLRMYGEDEAPLLAVAGLRLRPADAALLAGKPFDASWLYRISWQEREIPALPALSGPDRLEAAALQASGRLADAEDGAAFRAALPALDNLARRYAGRVAADRRMRADPDAVAPGKQRLWLHLQGLAADAEVADWRTLREEQASLAGRYPHLRRELALLARSADHLDDVLSGRRDAGEVLFPGGDTADLTWLYEQSPGARLLNATAGAALKEILAAAGVPLRIVEIGAGTGGTTAHLLPLLHGGGHRYTLTDISGMLLGEAEKRFGGGDGRLDYRRLDIEIAPAAQGFAVAGADVVIAANVLHATADLRRTLRHAASLLRPGGYLLILEITRPMPWLDLIFGLTDGWWKFSDRELRPSHPLLAAEQWSGLLEDCGFETARLLTGDSGQGTHAVIAARRADRLNLPVVLCAESGDPVADELARLLPNCRVYQPTSAESRWEPAPALVYLSGPDRGRSPVDAAAGLAFYLTWLKQASDRAGAERPLLLTVTQGASTAGGYASRPEQAMLWGLARVAELEYPEMRCRRVDLDERADAAAHAQALLRELTAADGEASVAWRFGKRFAARLTRLPEPKSAMAPYRLLLARRGSLDGLTIQALERRQPAAHEVEIRVNAAGLNMIDVLDTLDLLPFQRDWLGVECCGDIVAVGAAVTGWAPGDAVVALAPGCFASHVTVDARLLARRPASLNDSQAGGFPAAFLTAHHALREVGGLRAGQRILIHAAAGGTGMAALRLAQGLGAEVWATASRSKWPLLRDEGAAQIMDSRSLEFAEQVAAAGGVDVVFNALSGDFIAAGLSCLKPGGCFIEIGKRGIWTDQQVRDVRPDVRYECIDLMALARAEPERIGGMLRILGAQFDSGELAALPTRAFVAEAAAYAFATMQRAKHVGKLVLGFAAETAPIDRNAAYLITGGFGGLGLSTARWLVGEGAGRIILVGRREPAAEVLPVLEALGATGSAVTCLVVDVGDADALARMFRRIETEFEPLRGIFHAAGVLQDGALRQIGGADLMRALAPKALAAWHLHRLSLGCPLDYFELYSSAASLLGSPGQGAHVAANSYLDALAGYRQSLGLPAQALNWGPWADIGAAADADTQARMRERGIDGIPAAAGMRCFADLARRRQLAQAGVVAVRWRDFFRSGAEHDAFFEFFQASAATYPEGADQSAPINPEWARLRSLPPRRRQRVLVHLLRDEVAAVLGSAPGARPDPVLGFFDMGMDSLMTVELRNRLARQSGVTLNASAVFEYPNIEALAGYLANDAFAAATADPDEATLTVPVADGAADEARSGTDAADVDARIAAELAELTQLLERS